ncbi:BA75_04320T0 [Komagataella pastoris]|uniref:BA75_04320T0 n=1 Tax=Komagataella pastoris TaxID=4922 RepID=A0A1B2JGD8_PICPA|nr:BA75_04320T0 [Komagataella pastoris]
MENYKGVERGKVVAEGTKKEEEGARCFIFCFDLGDRRLETCSRWDAVLMRHRLYSDAIPRAVVGGKEVTQMKQRHVIQQLAENDYAQNKRTNETSDGRRERERHNRRDYIMRKTTYCFVLMLIIVQFS